MHRTHRQTDGLPGIKVHCSSVQQEKGIRKIWPLKGNTWSIEEENLTSAYATYRHSRLYCRKNGRWFCGYASGPMHGWIGREERSY